MVSTNVGANTSKPIPLTTSLDKKIMKETVKKCLFGEMENDPFFDCGISLSQSLLDQTVLNAACSVEDYTSGDINIPVCVGRGITTWKRLLFSQLKDSKDVPVEDSEEI